MCEKLFTPQALYKISCIILLCLCSISTDIRAEEFKIDKTSEDIPKKALITKKGAKLFMNAVGDDATEVPFMQLYFLMTPSKQTRVPVSNTFSITKTQPDGWLEKGEFIEWNTIQMIDFEPQQGRELVKIYQDLECSQRFGTGETLGECLELGREPIMNSSSKKQYKLLIPVLQQKQNNYYGGFIGTQEYGKEIKPLEATIGYDLILVVDSTLSMARYFPSAMRVLQNFVEQVGKSKEVNNIANSLNVGLLFYRDRDVKNRNCKVGYVTAWTQHLTERVEEVIKALKVAEATNCDDLDDPEAVFDAVNRAIVDTEWHPTHFRNVLLIGDAPPHSTTDIEKNPFQFNVSTLNQLAKEHNVRFLTFKIQDKDTQEFKDLALATDVEMRGRFRTIAKGDIVQFEQDLQKALLEEWAMVIKVRDIQSEGKNPANLSKKQLEALNISDYEYPIIKSNSHLPFIEGWVPQKIKGKLAISEYIFMKENNLKSFVNIIESINLSFIEGQQTGSDAVISAIRNTLAPQVLLNLNDVFKQGETLNETLKKVHVLPFRSEILEITPEQINTFKPLDYRKISDTLSEKVKSLREFLNNPLNIHKLGADSYFYVPRKLFP